MPWDVYLMYLGAFKLFLPTPRLSCFAEMFGSKARQDTLSLGQEGR